ncbi:MAG: hypothetical protein ACYSXF_04385 [Planctomycetota bacterium]|jgi:hypothetical protein
MLILADLAESMLTMPNLFFVVCGTVAIVGIVAGAATKMATTRARERTKREIAAYVAEGSIDADKAVAMLKAGEAPSGDREA